MAHLYLHIGTGKTATTLIQNYCNAHRDDLAQHGLCYPDSGRSRLASGRRVAGHQELAAALLENPTVNRELHTTRPFAEVLDEVLAECAAYPRVLLSSEMLWKPRIHKRRPGLLALLEAFDAVTVIAYARRQDAWAVSAYNEIVKTMHTRHVPSFADYAARAKHDVGAAMALWGDLLGEHRLIVRPFVRAAWRDGDILADFFAQIDPELPVYCAAGLPANASVPLAAIALLRHMCDADLAEPKRLAWVIREAAAELPERPDEGLLTPAIQRSILERFADSNRRMAERFWTAEEARLFFEEEVKTYPNPYSGPTAEEVAHILAAVWRDLTARQAAAATSPQHAPGDLADD